MSELEENKRCSRPDRKDEKVGSNARLHKNCVEPDRIIRNWHTHNHYSKLLRGKLWICFIIILFVIFFFQNSYSFLCFVYLLRLFYAIILHAFFKVWNTLNRHIHLNMKQNVRVWFIFNSWTDIFGKLTTIQTIFYKIKIFCFARMTVTSKCWDIKNLY